MLSTHIFVLKFFMGLVGMGVCKDINEVYKKTNFEWYLVDYRN